MRKIKIEVELETEELYSIDTLISKVNRVIMSMFFYSCIIKKVEVYERPDN